MAPFVPFKEYLKSLTPFVPTTSTIDGDELDLCQRTTRQLAGLETIDREQVTGMLQREPDIARVLAAVVGLSQERFKTWLKHRFMTAGWIRLSRDRAAELVGALDEDYGLIALLSAERAREWTWSDALVRTMSSRQHAGASVRQGRDLEDAVEAKVSALGLRYTTRTRFVGKGGNTAPADFAIHDGEATVIAVAVKGFDSTGSKLSDAAREIEEMVSVKTPRQFIYAVVDGQGWTRRQNDLRRIHSLWENQLIDGVFPREKLDDFGAELRVAARRLGLLDGDGSAVS